MPSIIFHNLNQQGNSGNSTPTIENFNLGTSVNITSIGTTNFTNSGVSLTLPSAGYYNIKFSIATMFSGSGSETFDNKYITGRLFDVTNNLVIENTETYLISLEQFVATGDFFPRQAYIDHYLSVSTSIEIALQVKSHSLSPFNAYIDSDRTNYGYIKF